MTEPSKRATSLANQFYDGGYFGSSHDDVLWAARLIDAALTEARKEALAIAKERAEYADKCRREAEWQGCRAVKAESERDELADTVDRVYNNLVLDWLRLDRCRCATGYDGGYNDGTYQVARQVLDALDGGGSDE